MEGTPGPSSLESKESNVGKKRRIWQSLGAAIGLVLAGPALAVVLPLLATMLLLGGCCALLVVASPFAIPRLIEDEDPSARSGVTAVVLRELVTEDPRNLLDKQQRPHLGDQVLQNDLSPQTVGSAPKILP